jgi:hypothetical protein
VAKTLSEQEILRLARLGALARLRELEEEARAIRKMFPGLKGAVPEGAGDAPKPERKPKPRKRSREISPEARQAASERMRAYWARKKGLAPVPAEGPVEGSGTAADAARKPRTRKTRSRSKQRG